MARDSMFDIPIDVGVGVGVLGGQISQNISGQSNYPLPDAFEINYGLSVGASTRRALAAPNSTTLMVSISKPCTTTSTSCATNESFRRAANK